MTTIATIMTPDPITCHETETLEAATQRMWDRDVGALIVTDAVGRPTAVITDRDVAMAAYTQGQTLARLRVAVAMSSDVCVVRQDGHLEEAERLMQNHRVRRLPVVDASGRLVGVVALADLAWCAEPRADADVSPADVLSTLRAVCAPPAEQRRIVAAE